MNYVGNSVWGFDTGARTSMEASGCCLSMVVGGVFTTIGGGCIYYSSSGELSEDLSNDYLIVGSISTVAGCVFLSAPLIWCAGKCYLNKCWRQKSSTDYPVETSAFNQSARSI